MTINKITPVQEKLLEAIKQMPGDQFYCEILRDRARAAETSRDAALLSAEIQLDYLDNPHMVSQCLTAEVMKLLNLKIVTWPKINMS